jgi:hypothetical protein
MGDSREIRVSSEIVTIQPLRHKEIIDFNLTHYLSAGRAGGK